MIWKPINKKALASDRLFEYSTWIDSVLYTHRPDRVVVSVTSFSRSHKTTRVLARYEAATILKAKLYSCEVVEAKDSQARSLILSKGSLSKQEAYDEVTHLLPDYPWLPFEKGGNDQTDSWTFAMAGSLLELS